MSILGTKAQNYLLKHPEIDRSAFEVINRAVIDILICIGENPEREGLKDTPYRVAKMLLGETMSGYGQDPVAIAKSAAFEDAKKGDLVLVKNIKFYSTCEHHIMPFMGEVHIAYVPKKKVIGLSKIPRVVKAVSRKLQLQENMGHEILLAIQEATEASDVVVIVEATDHTCMTARGIEAYGTNTTTIASCGDAALVATVLNSIRGGK